MHICIFFIDSTIRKHLIWPASRHLPWRKSCCWSWWVIGNAGKRIPPTNQTPKKREKFLVLYDWRRDRWTPITYIVGRNEPLEVQVALELATDTLLKFQSQASHTVIVAVIEQRTNWSQILQKHKSAFYSKFCMTASPILQQITIEIRLVSNCEQLTSKHELI